jgi:tRNA dimethylallyltransferase
MADFKQLALIGPTASGKTALAVKVAQKMNAHILSLDSLSIYKEIDIVSAKPTQEERQDILHFGIDHLFPDTTFDVTTYIDLYTQTKERCQKDHKNLVIVGGTSFYLKILTEGISKRPKLTSAHMEKISIAMKKPETVYEKLHKIDASYMRKISEGDTYRIQKALEIYLATGEKPGSYFEANPPQRIITETLPIYEIIWDRSQLRERIAKRTKQMLKDGLIDEIIYLEKKYTRTPNCMKAIGIKETLMYLDGIYDRKMLMEKISVNTGRLAKRQMTFNNSQFQNVVKGSVEELEKLLL